ncbi:MAG: protein kinase, partial [Planctomycetaceae bacterium]|nr:protein kinase [Planctomycetaceae bacterium]
MSGNAAESFMTTLRRSNLLAPEQVALAASLAADSDAVSVARDLILREWLTEWQARQLLAGKSKLYLGKYKLMDVLGQGGMGAVLKAESTTLRREVALKVMATNLHDDGVARARFEREIAFSASLNHPNIVRAIDADQIGNRFFLVMEYFSGRDLKAVVKEHGQVSVEFACECIRQAALGLQHAFERGIVHRDIKPSNLLVTKDSKTGQPLIKILDLGLARVAYQDELATSGPANFEAADGGVTRSGQIMGSPDYMSPEQAMSSSTVDIRSDIYGLGVTLFQLLCNELPYTGENVMEKLLERINKDAPPVSVYRPELPPVLVHIVAKMLHRDPAQRFQTPAEVAAVLEAFAADPQSLEIQPEPEPSPPLTGLDLPTLDAQADETLNVFVADLNSEAVVVREPVGSARPFVRRRQKNFAPLAISLGTAAAMVGIVLFVLSQGSGPPEKKPGPKPPSAKKHDTATSKDSIDQNSGITTGEIVALPPPSSFLTTGDPLTDWVRVAAGEIRVETNAGESVVKASDPLPKSQYTIVGVDLSGVQILTPDNLRLLASGKSIRHLNLSGSRLKDSHLRQVTRLKELRFLNIGSTMATDEGLESLSRCKDLTSLQLPYVSVGDAGISHLTALTALSDLDLEGTDITDAVVKSLASLTGLTRLNLKHTALSEESVDKLRKRLPNCKVE